jgi:hypothetical protein
MDWCTTWGHSLLNHGRTSRRSGIRIVAAALLAVGLCASAPADAQPAAPAQPTSPGPPPDQARGYAVPPGVEPEDVGLFVPRALLFIPRMALKAAFFPITKTLSVLDRYAVIETIEDVLYNDERTAAIVPVLSADTFFGPTIGVKAFHENLAGHGERGSIDARFGGQYEQAYQIAFRADFAGGSRAWVESIARFEIDPALLFQGIGDADTGAGGSGLGPRDAAVETRFRQQRFLSMQRLGYTVGEGAALTKIGLTGTLNNRAFDPAHKASDPSIETVYDTSRIVGFDRGVDVFELTGNLVVDTRDVYGATSSGAYVELFGGGALPLGDFTYWHYGAEVTGYFDLYRKTRVLVVRAALEATEGDSDAIPFSELPRLGGPYRLRGYPQDRFRDEKAAVGTVEYHYPIHQFIAGSLYADVGHVAPGYKELFDSKWSVGVGGGFIFRSRDHVLLTLDVAYGDGVHVYATTDPLRAFSKRDTEL